MTSDVPLYESDPQAWRKYLAEGNARQPRKRVSADLIILDRSGRILIVEPKYKPDWDLPGGMVEANEPPAQAARREVHEELGLDIVVGELLCVDWVAPHGPWDDLLAFIFHGGTIGHAEAAGIHLQDDELKAFEFCEVETVRQRLRPYVWRRTAAALDALRDRRGLYLHDGHHA
jgi:8-oxo-dGTP pyrophosphatase MutT (NUDIX family)